MQEHFQKINNRVSQFYNTKRTLFFIVSGGFLLFVITGIVFVMFLGDPSPVEDVRLERSDFDEIRVTWADSGSADSYQIYRSKDISEGFETIGTTENRHYVDRQLDPETVYYYVVTKVVNEKESEFSQVVQETTGAVGPPTNLRADEIGDNYIKIAWDGYEKNEGYTVYRADSLDTPRFPITTTKNDYYVDNQLNTNTAYYYFVTQKVRGEETDFSSQLTVATRDWICGNNVNHDDDFYKTRKIGEQCWFAENLNYVTQEGSWCYDNEEENCDRFGRMYNWETALSGEGNSSQGICPEGWKVPTDEDYKVLERSLGMSRINSNENGWRGEDSKVGDRLKAAIDCSDRGDETCASSEVNLELGGSRSSAGAFRYIRSHGFYWTSTVNEDDAIRRLIAAEETGVHRDFASKENGFYVRCVKEN